MDAAVEPYDEAIDAGYRNRMVNPAGASAAAPITAVTGDGSPFDARLGTTAMDTNTRLVILLWRSPEMTQLCSTKRTHRDD